MMCLVAGVQTSAQAYLPTAYEKNYFK